VGIVEKHDRCHQNGIEQRGLWSWSPGPQFQSWGGGWGSCASVSGLYKAEAHLSSHCWPSSNLIRGLKETLLWHIPHMLQVEQRLKMLKPNWTAMINSWGRCFNEGSEAEKQKFWNSAFGLLKVRSWNHAIIILSSAPEATIHCKIMHKMHFVLIDFEHVNRLTSTHQNLFAHTLINLDTWQIFHVI